MPPTRNQSLAPTEPCVIVPGRGLGQLCRGAQIAYAVKRSPLGVLISEADRAQLESAIATRNQREKRALQSGWASKAIFARRFPLLEIPDELRTQRLAIFESLEEVSFELLTRTEIDNLQLQRNRRGGAILYDKGATVTFVYHASAPPPPSPRISDEAIHATALSNGFWPHRALWALNKLVKITKNSRHMSSVNVEAFYSLKDRLLSRWDEHCFEGRIARQEHYTTLYEARYRFPGDHREYCFHTYSRPSNLSTTPGADLPRYGFRFTPDECTQIPFGIHELFGILRHEVAAPTLFGQSHATHGPARPTLPERYHSL